MPLTDGEVIMNATNMLSPFCLRLASRSCQWLLWEKLHGKDQLSLKATNSWASSSRSRQAKSIRNCVLQRVTVTTTPPTRGSCCRAWSSGGGVTSRWPSKTNCLWLEVGTWPTARFSTAATLFCCGRRSLSPLVWIADFGGRLVVFLSENLVLYCGVANFEWSEKEFAAVDGVGWYSCAKLPKF